MRRMRRKKSIVLKMIFIIIIFIALLAPYMAKISIALSQTQKLENNSEEEIEVIIVPSHKPDVNLNLANKMNQIKDQLNIEYIESRNSKWWRRW